MYTTSDNVKLNWIGTRTHSPSHVNTLKYVRWDGRNTNRKSYAYKSRLIKTSFDFMELEDS
jgi:hypothetical protein